MRCDEVKCNVRHYNAMQRHIKPGNTTQFHTILYNALLQFDAMYRCMKTNKYSVPNPYVTDYNRLLAAYNSKLEEKATGQDVVSTLGNLHDLSLLEELTNSSTSAGTVDLQTVHNGIDSDELHLDGSYRSAEHTLGTSATNLS